MRLTAVAAWMISRVGLVAVGLAAAGDGAVAEDRARFDIAGGALADALYAYSAATGIEVLVPGDQVQRRRTAGLAGTFAPADALRALLLGTGLSARAIGANAVTLAPSAEPAGPVGPPAFVTPPHPDYSAALQAAVTSALCRLRETRPGHYRLAARLWIGRRGAVTQVALLGTTGDGERDALLATMLQGVDVGEAPPADLVQPTTMLILPQREGAAVCAGRAER